MDSGPHYRRDGDPHGGGSVPAHQDRVPASQNTGDLQCGPGETALILQRQTGPKCLFLMLSDSHFSLVGCLYYLGRGGGDSYSAS